MAEVAIPQNRVMIYGLVDPRTSHLFYVGRTETGLNVRLTTHRSAAKRNDSTKVARKVRGLLLAGVEPEAFVIETVPYDVWQEAEQFWIEYFRFIGCQLLNMTIGGDGLNGLKRRQEDVEKTRRFHIGRKRSDETKKRISQAWTAERKAAHVAAHKGRPPSQKCRAAVSAALKGKKQNPEVVARRAAKQRGRKQSPEQKAKSGAGIKASWTLERREDQAKRFREYRLSVPLKTHCPRGHELSGDNLYTKPSGARECRACRRKPEVTGG